MFHNGWIACVLIIGCQGPNQSVANTAPGLNFTQRFEGSTLCFDDDGADAGHAVGCATDPWLDLIVVDGAVQDGSEIGLTGGDHFTVNGLPYTTAVVKVEPVVGNFTWDDDGDDETEPICFSGELEHKNESIGVELELQGGVGLRQLQLTVEISGDDEASTELRATDPVDVTFAGDSAVICPAPEPEDSGSDTGDTAVDNE